MPASLRPLNSNASRKNMRIRTVTGLDRDDILETYLCAFPEGERDIVSKLAVDLLFESAAPQTISLVTEIDNAVVGNVAFSPVKIDDDDSLQGYILAPLAVMTDYQKQKIGTGLVEKGMQMLLEMEVNILFVYGDPEYYGRFGFSAKNAEKFIPQYKLQYPFGWQAVILNEFSIKHANSNLVCVASLNNPKLW